MSNSATKSISTDIAACTDVGLVRKNNEDAFLIADLALGRDLGDVCKVDCAPGELYMLLAVSDGMGGHSAGEFASKLTVETLFEKLLKLPRKIRPNDRLVQAVEEANYKVYRESRLNAERQGMGATLTAALIEGDKVYIAEVGDSRAYIMREGRIKQVTTDQSLIEIFVSRGLLSAADAERSTNRGMLLQAIGTKEEIQVAVTSFTLQNNDRLLLCSDGLSNKLKSREILEMTLKRDSALATCQDMIVEARRRGGEDNITGLLARFGGNGLENKGTGHSAAKLTTMIQTLATFDPDRPKIKKRTQGLASATPGRRAAYPHTIGIDAPNRDWKNYPKLKELMAEFERLSHHLDKAGDSLLAEIEALKEAADWMQEVGSLDMRLPDMVNKLRNALSMLEQTKKSVLEAKERFQK